MAGRNGVVLGWSLRIVGLTRVLAAIALFALLYDPVQASQSITLIWDRSPDTNVMGYRVYYGVASRTYTNLVSAGNATNVTIFGLVDGATYYFAATAYNLLGLESDFSYEIVDAVPTTVARLQIRAAPAGQFIVTVTGPAGRTNDILATQDFKTWTKIGTAIVGAGGSMDFTDTNAASFLWRFYRTQQKP